MISGLFVTTLWHWTAAAETLPPLREVRFRGESVEARVQKELHSSFWKIVDERLPGSISERRSEEVGKVALLDESLDMFMENSVILKDDSLLHCLLDGLLHLRDEDIRLLYFILQSRDYLSLCCYCCTLTTICLAMSFSLSTSDITSYVHRHN